MGIPETPMRSEGSQRVVTGRSPHGAASETVSIGKESLTRIEVLKEAAREYVENSEEYRKMQAIFPKRYAEILEDEDIRDECLAALAIVDKYRASDYDADITTLSKDAEMLSALAVRIGMLAAQFIGLSNDAESRRKMAKSQYFNAIKSSAERKKLKITDSEADHISRTMSLDFYSYLSDLGSYSAILNNFYYSIRSFAELLLSNANRQARELRG
jgi:hypothetical protein